ncbi:MAG TPA: hypothetical protein VHQ43_06765 [Solirubrobacterales bacterium]|jgi:hypothetical protein|nr:hypothetical protein [Solirubrobacterales bacterium]
MALTVIIAVISAATAHAYSHYKLVICAADNGAAGPAAATNYPGQFSFEDHCGASHDPGGDNAYLRIAETSTGTAPVNAYASLSWSMPSNVVVLAGGGYTREPNAFNDGWRGRYWAEDFGGGTNNILMQGTNAANSGINWSPTSTFASHLWPFGGYGSYRRFIFELTCMRPAGCDRSNYNALDANTMVLVLEDVQPVQLWLTDAHLLNGRWARGKQAISYRWNEQGSGIRKEWIDIDGARRFTIDHYSECNAGYSAANGEFARAFQPCATAMGIGRTYDFDTASLSDGTHTVQACAQDYAQWKGLDGTGSASCESRTVRTDNTAPGAPSGLEVTSANSQRYLQHLGARWQLPSNAGSPIIKVHYSVLDAGGQVVVPEQSVSATNPTVLSQITGPANPGEYRLRLWLEDEVGLQGPASTVAIPRDTTPPAPPQNVSVTRPDMSRSEEGFDLRWQNIGDQGSPIDAAHYQVLSGGGEVVVPTHDLKGENVQSVRDLDPPSGAGDYRLRLWLSDAEGNVGAAASVPLTYECPRSPVAGGVALSTGLGDEGVPAQIVAQGEGSALSGTLRGATGSLSGASLCVFGRITTSSEREFLGTAITGSEGRYRFPIPPGPSRDLEVRYRPDQRQIAAHATLYTRVKPTFRVRKKTVRNGHFAYFSGEIPGPDNDGVLIVLQVKSGEGWRAFRRYRTRSGGRYEMRYRFTQTHSSTTYITRAQERSPLSHPYLEGNSDTLRLHVMP